MKPKKIDLNQYVRVIQKDELDGYQGLVIIPTKLIDGTQLPELYFRKGEPKHEEISDVDNAMWNKEVRISNKGNDFEYAHRVDWWFENALENSEYKTMLNNTFNKHGFDVRMSWEKAITWLKQQVPSARKTYLNKFIWNWLMKGLRWQINRLERERSKS